MNLLQETIAAIEHWSHTSADIVFIGSLSSGHSCSWAEFSKLANLEYDEGYGRQYVASDLVIVFADGSHLYREEYDGSERWEFQQRIAPPILRREIKTLVCGDAGVGFQSLSGLNK
jgi:hypothetical protein